MSYNWKKYRKIKLQEMRPLDRHEILTGKLPMRVSVSDADKENGSPKAGDMIARNPEDHSDQWLISKEFFEENYESMAERKGNMTDEGHPGVYTTSDG